MLDATGAENVQLAEKLSAIPAVIRLRILSGIIIGMRCSAVLERGWDEGGASQSPAATASSPFCCLTATSSPGRGKSFKGRALGRTGRFRPYRSTARRSQPIAGKLSALAKASPFGGGGTAKP